MPASVLFILFIIFMTFPIWLSEIIVRLTPFITRQKFLAHRFPIYTIAMTGFYILFPIYKASNEKSLSLLVIFSIVYFILLLFAFSKNKAVSAHKKNEIDIKAIMSELKKKITCFLILFIIVGIPIIWLNPTKEIMSCNKNYVCTVNQDFLFGIKWKKQYFLSRHSNIKFLHKKEEYHAKQYSPAESNFQYTDAEHKTFFPFIKSDSIRDHYEWWLKDDENMFKEAEIKKSAFSDYIAHPEKEYTVMSSANSESAIDILLIEIICILIPVCLINFKEYEKDIQNDMENKNN